MKVCNLNEKTFIYCLLPLIKKKVCKHSWKNVFRNLKAGRRKCMFETIKYEVSNHTAWITLNRPDKLNAFTDTMNKEITKAIKNVKRDVEVRCLVITGSE